jgi:hypothetical protein
MPAEVDAVELTFATCRLADKFDGGWVKHNCHDFHVLMS